MNIYSYIYMYVCTYVCMYVWVEMDYDGTIVFIDIYIYTNGFMLIFRVYVNLPEGVCIYICVCVGKL